MVVEEEARAAHAAHKLVVSARNHALTCIERESRELRKAQQRYEGAVLHAVDLGCGSSAIGRAAGLSEAAIRGFVRRRRAS